jgi:PAS domain S-box-containing protein
MLYAARHNFWSEPTAMQTPPPAFFDLDSKELMACTAKDSPFPKCWILQDGSIRYGNTTFQTTFCKPNEALPFFYDMEMGLDINNWGHRWRSIIQLSHFETEALLKQADEAYTKYRLLFYPTVFNGETLLSLWMVEQTEEETPSNSSHDSAMIHAALEYSQDAIWDWDLVSNQVYYSEQAYRQWGYTRKEFPGTLSAFESVVHPDDFAFIQSAVYNHINHNEPYHVEYRIRCKSGDYRWFMSKGSAIRNKQGVAVRFVGINADIHHLKSLSAELNRQREEYKLLLDNIPACIFYKDDKNNIILANQRACESIGLPAHKIEGRSTLQFFPQELAHQYYQDDMEVIHSNMPKRNIIEPYKTPVGETRWMRTDKIPLPERPDGSRTLLVVAFDVTEEMHHAEISTPKD